MMPSAPGSGGFSGAAVWSVSLKDDITAVSQKMAGSMDTLRADVKQLGDAFKKTNVGNLTIGLKDARKMFRDAGHNAVLFKAALKDMGVSALDTRLLVGKLTGELTNMRKGVLGMDGLFSRVFNPRTIWVASHALNVMSKGWGVISTVAGGALNIVTSLAEKMFDVGKGIVDTVIESAQFRQNAITGMTYMLDGNEQAAKDLFKSAQALAQDTPLDTDVIVSSIKSFLTQGYSASESKLLAKVMADQGSKFLDDPSVPKNVENAFNRIRGRSVATAEDLESFRTARFNEGAIMEQLLANPALAPLFKGIKKDASQEEKIHEVKKVLGQGKIGSYSFANAAIGSLEAGGKSDVGELAKSYGQKSLTGAISNFKSVFKDLIQSVDLDQWEGIVAFKEFIGTVVNMLKAGSPAGEALLGTVRKVMNDLLGGFARIKPDDISRWVGKLGAFATTLGDGIKAAWEWLDKLIHADTGGFLAAVGDVLVDVGAHIGAGIWKGVKLGVDGLTADKDQRKYGTAGMTGIFDYQAKLRGGDANTVRSAFSDQYDAFRKAGNAIPTPAFGQSQADATFAAVTEWGKTQLVQQAASSMWAVGQAFIQGGVGGAKEEGQIKSPSRVMWAIGENLVKGMVDGAEKTSDRSAGKAGGVGGGPVKVEININAPGGDPAAIERAIEGPVMRQLTAFFERAGLEA